MSGRTVHPFPARMAPDIALKSIARYSTGRSRTVLDPMCGSGTVLAAAASGGHRAFGFDLDPLAVLMSNVAVRPVNTTALMKLTRSVVGRARRSRATSLPWRDKETSAFACYWFAPAQLLALSRLSRAIHEVPDSPARDVLWIALSRIIVTKAPKASLAADTSHSRPHRTVDQSEYDVLAGFTRSAEQLTGMLAARRMSGAARAAIGDSRDIPMADSSVDLIVTSPPYLNAIDYLRGHRLALIWMGYSIPALREIRSASIGAERGPDDPPEPEVLSMVDAVQRLTQNRPQFPRRLVERYALDLTRFAAETHRVCRGGGRIVLVIGNSTIRGSFVRNDLLARRALRGAGFEVTSSRTRELPEARRYLPVRADDMSSPIAKRMRTEVVMTARKR